jgi:hypothetical protein
MPITYGVRVSDLTAPTASSRAGVGYSENPSSFEAGAEAARLALAQAGVNDCDLVLLFATDKQDPEPLRDGVRSVVGPRPRLMGGAAMGVITNDRRGHEGHQVGVAVVSAPSLHARLYIERGLPNNERNVGRALAEQIKADLGGADPTIVLLYDIVKQRMSQGLSLNMATPLLAGFADVLGHDRQIVGGGLMGSLQWNPGFQLFDDLIEQQSAMALVLEGGLRMDTVTLHGCVPSSGYHKITKSDGNVVLELDGEPTLDVIARLSGDPDTSNWQDYPLFITLGVNHGDKYGPYREEDYAVRLCMDVDRERRGLVFFGDDLTAGTDVQIMRRTIDFDYIRRRTQELVDRLEGRTPLLGLYIDCAGRADVFTTADREEAEEVQNVVGNAFPLLGWYVGCEIARAGPIIQSHNWTGILCVLSE